MTSQLSIEKLSHSYDSTTIFNDLSFTLNNGESLAIVGESGCGKSTILKCIASLIRPLKGRVRLGSEVYIDVQNKVYKDIAPKVTMVFQGYNLFPNMTGLKNITTPLKYTLGLSQKEAVSEAIDICNRLDIEHLLSKYPETYSGGEAQRLALARALVLKPDVLLLDEITSALDRASVMNVLKAIKEIKSINSNMIVIYVTHVLDFAMHTSDYIAYMSKNRGLTLSKPKDILQHSDDEMAAFFDLYMGGYEKV